MTAVHGLPVVAAPNPSGALPATSPRAALAGASALVAALAHAGASLGTAYVWWRVRYATAPDLISANGGILPHETAGRVQAGLLVLAFVLLTQALVLAYCAVRMLASRSTPWDPSGNATARRIVLVAVAVAAPTLPLLAAVAVPSWAWLVIPALLSLATMAAGLALQQWQVKHGPQAPKPRPTAWVCPRCTRGYTNVHGAGPVPTCPQCG